jgi:SsrA-binding protein
MKTHNKINIKNKRAFHDYEIIEKFMAGIVLMGTEVKSIRMGKVSLADAYCVFSNTELFVRNMQINEYPWASYSSHAVGRERKLLLNRSELKRLSRKVKETGLTIVPLRLFITDTGFVKMDIALAKGKKLYDKRETIKLKDTQRQMDRVQRIK